MYSAFRIPHSAFLVWLAFAATSWAADWPMFRGNSQLTGVSSDRLAEPLKVQWKFQVEESFESSAAIVRGVAYIGCDDNMFYALDINTGAVVWKFAANGPIKSSPLVLDKTVFFGDDEGILYALDSSIEAKDIRAPNREPTLDTPQTPRVSMQGIGPPEAGGGASRVGHPTSAPADPRVRWTFQTEGQIISSPNHASGRIIFGSYDGHLYCLDAKTGALAWKRQTEDRLHGTPGIADGRVLIAGCDQRLHVVDLSDGEPVSEVTLGAVSGGSAALAGSRVFIGTYGNHILGIDWSAGRVLWTFEDPDRQFPFMGSAAVTSQAVILGGRDKRLRALAPDTGNVHWTFVAGGRIDSSPVIAGDRVWVGSSDGNLYAIDLSGGQEKWRFESGAPISASPAIADGRLVVGNEDGVLYCFGGDEPQRHRDTEKK